MMAAIRFRAFDDAAPALAELRAERAPPRLRVELGRVASRGARALRAGRRARRRRHLGGASVPASPTRRSSRRRFDSPAARPREALHVGDTPAEDVAGARAAGIRSLSIDRRGDAEIDSLVCIRHHLADE